MSSDTAVGASAASNGLTLKGKVAVGSKVQSSPAVVFNQNLNKTLVYIETMSSVLLALDANTGARVWSYTQPGLTGAYSSPAVFGDTVYVGGSKDHSMWAVGATTGKLQCSFQTNGRILDGAVAVDLGSGPEVSSAIRA